MQPRYPVYIPSKGRAEPACAVTVRALRSDGVPFRVVVEPQEADAYRALAGAENVLILPFSNLGLGSIPARNWIRDHAERAGFARHWQLGGIGETIGETVVASPPPVVVTCKNGHTARSTEAPPEVLSAEEVADYEQLRSLVSPERSLALLDDFAKWLFAIAATVATLGASFGVSNANELKGGGKTIFAVAVAAVGVSLALTALARLPLRIGVNRYSDVDLAENVARIVKVRGILLKIAAVLFAVALVLAGLSPLVS